MGVGVRARERGWRVGKSAGAGAGGGGPRLFGARLVKGHVSHLLYEVGVLWVVHIPINVHRCVG
jgi:hypothetical protein